MSSVKLYRYNENESSDDFSDDLKRDERNQEKVGSFMSNVKNGFRKMVGMEPKYYPVSRYDATYPDEYVRYDTNSFHCHNMHHPRGQLTANLSSVACGVQINNICGADVVPGLFVMKCKKPGALVYRHRIPQNQLNAIREPDLGTLRMNMKIDFGCGNSICCSGLIDLVPGECPNTVYVLGNCRLEFNQTCVQVKDPCNPCVVKSMNVYYLVSITFIVPHCVEY